MAKDGWDDIGGLVGVVVGAIGLAVSTRRRGGAGARGRVRGGGRGRRAAGGRPARTRGRRCELAGGGGRRRGGERPSFSTARVFLSLRLRKTGDRGFVEEEAKEGAAL